MAKSRKVLGKVEPVVKKWLSTAEAQAYLDCSSNWLQKLRDEDLIRFSTISGKFFYELASIDRLLEYNKV